MVDIIEMPKPNLSDMQKAIELMKADLPAFLEFHELQALIMRTRYSALLEEGFDEVQALELCKIL